MTAEQRATTEQDQAAQPNPRELTEAELEKVYGGIIAVLIGKASQAITAVSVPLGTPLF